MTPKEKAKELVDRCYWVFGDGYLGDQHIQCALIAVDQILSIDVLIDEDTWVSKTSYLEFWKEVKKELEKI
jgi:hypothetical protein